MSCDSLLYNETVFHEISSLSIWKPGKIMLMSKSVDTNSLIRLFLSGAKWLISVFPAPSVNICKQLLM